jgi:hypothetical protein
MREAREKAGIRREKRGIGREKKKEKEKGSGRKERRRRGRKGEGRNEGKGLIRPSGVPGICDERASLLLRSIWTHSSSHSHQVRHSRSKKKKKKQHADPDSYFLFSDFNKKTRCILKSLLESFWKSQIFPFFPKSLLFIFSQHLVGHGQI